MSDIVMLSALIERLTAALQEQGDMECSIGYAGLYPPMFVGREEITVAAEEGKKILVLGEYEYGDVIKRY